MTSSNYASGHRAEVYAAQELERQGFEILELNWRTKICEIDVVARQHQTVYFIEVKYRLTGQQGSGLDYITTKKQHQMRFAAEIWVQMRGWRDGYELAAIEVTNADFAVGELVYL